VAFSAGFARWFWYNEYLFSRSVDAADDTDGRQASELLLAIMVTHSTLRPKAIAMTTWPDS
jgi:hypothetical protein